jgi:hypothetical protein
VSAAALQDESEIHALLPTSASNASFASYAADLAAEIPRFGGTYQFSAQGGGLAAPLSVPVHLPEALSISSLLETERVPKGALTLRWEGHGEAPLQLRMWVEPTLRDVTYPYEIECVLRDDGEYVLPEGVLGSAPEGFVTAIFTREVRTVQASGAQRLLSLGVVRATHRFALGDACDRADVLSACQRFAAHQAAEYAACGVDPPPAQSTCPAYLAEACTGCSAYFECRTEGLRCEDGTLTSYGGCSCP